MIKGIKTHSAGPAEYRVFSPTYFWQVHKPYFQSRGLGADYDPRTFRLSYGSARVLFCVTKFSTLWNDGTFWPLSNAICRTNGCEPIIRVSPKGQLIPE